MGLGKGKYYSVNIPLKDGITDKPFVQIFSRLVLVLLKNGALIYSGHALNIKLAMLLFH